MSLFGFLNKRSTAPVARERLQILLNHERAVGGQSDLAVILQEEILKVIARHIPLDRDKVQVKVDRDGVVSTLEIDVELPDTAAAG